MASQSRGFVFDGRAIPPRLCRKKEIFASWAEPETTLTYLLVTFATLLSSSFYLLSPFTPVEANPLNGGTVKSSGEALPSICIWPPLQLGRAITINLMNLNSRLFISSVRGSPIFHYKGRLNGRIVYKRKEMV